MQHLVYVLAELSDACVQLAEVLLLLGSEVVPPGFLLDTVVDDVLDVTRVDAQKRLLAQGGEQLVHRGRRRRRLLDDLLPATRGAALEELEVVDVGLPDGVRSALGPVLVDGRVEGHRDERVLKDVVARLLDVGAVGVLSEPFAAFAP